MAVEIRELRIKGIVHGSGNNIQESLNNQSSRLNETLVLKNLKSEILNKCKDMIKAEFERKNQR